MKVMTNEQVELIADVFEALEKMKQWMPLYKTVLRQTGSKEEARAAVKYAMRIEKEMEKAA